MYSVELAQQPQKFLTKLPMQIADRVLTKLKKLKNKPVPHDAKFIGRHEGDKVFRIRIGSYRALYKIKEASKIVLVTKLDKRPRVYD